MTTAVRYAEGMTPTDIEAVRRAAFAAWHAQPPRDDLTAVQIAMMGMYPELEVLVDGSVRVRFANLGPVEVGVPILVWPLVMARADDGSWRLAGIGILDLGPAIERIRL